MAKLDFPPTTIGGNPPQDGTIWTSPVDGKQWVYVASIPAWKGFSQTGPGVVYRGGIDMTQDPNAQYANIVSGNLFTVTTGTLSADGSYPGLENQEVPEKSEIIYDGSEWQNIAVFVPDATETIKGKAQIATQTEVDTGTNDTDIVTPLKLKTYIDKNPELPPGTTNQWLKLNPGGPVWADLPTSTTNISGITRYATEAEVNDGTEENAAVTPASLSEFVNQIINRAIPTGAIFWFASSSVPNGYLVCNGSVISRDDHPALFDLIGSTYGSAGRLPDLRGEFIRGWDNARGVDSNRTFGSSQTDEFGEHRHTTNIDNRTVELSGGGNYSMGPGNRPQTARGFGQMSLEGGVETRPRNIALLPCIKT